MPPQIRELGKILSLDFLNISSLNDGSIKAMQQPLNPAPLKRPP